MVVSDQVQRAVCDKECEFPKSAVPVLFCLTFHPRNAEHDIAEKQVPGLFVHGK